MVTTACLDKLLRFEGYGPAKPTTILLGVEEKVDELGIAVNLETHCQKFRHPRYDKNLALDDLFTAYTTAKLSTATLYRAAKAPGGNVPTWDFASMVIAALRAPLPCSMDGTWRSTWPAEYLKLGTDDGDSLLTELYPLPNIGIGKWPTAFAALGDPFRYKNAASYYQGVWPRNHNSLRRTVIEGVLVGLDRNSTVICYGRGSGGEFWQRHDDILGPLRWEVIVPGRVEVATHRTGAAVARVGFPWGKHPSSCVTDEHVPALVNALSAARQSE